MGIENSFGQPQTPPAAQERPQPAKFSREWLETRNTLQFEVHADLGPLRARLSEALGVDLGLGQRAEGFHVTIIGPSESEKLKALTDEQVARLKEIQQAIVDGTGVTIAGIGVIDGATAPGIRPADKAKKTAYVALDVPALNEFREQLGLPKKDLHITIGFVENDIHQQIIGSETDAKGKKKDVFGPIPKQADPAYDGYRDLLGEVRFGELDGQAKQEKQGKK